MYAIILQEVIFIVSVELPTLILGPLELFLSELHTHSMLSVAIKLSLLVCNSSEKAELLIFCTEKYELKLDDMSYYILYTFQTPMFTLFCPTVKYVLLFYAETICLHGYFNNFILKICGCIIYPTKGFMFLPFMWGTLHGFKLTM